MLEFAAKAKPYGRWIMLVPLIMSGIWFSILEKYVTKPDYLMRSFLDSYIPFVPEFVIPYVVWYGYVALTAFFLFWRSPEDFIKMAAFLTLGMLIACAIYTAFPNGQALRPVLRYTGDSLSDVVYHIYQMDTPANCAPSIHVVYSIGAHIAIAHFNNARKRIRWINWTSLVISGLCAVSTVFVKQHSIIDLFAGVALSAALYVGIYRREAVLSLLRPKVSLEK